MVPLSHIRYKTGPCMDRASLCRNDQQFFFADGKKFMADQLSQQGTKKTKFTFRLSICRGQSEDLFSTLQQEACLLCVSASRYHGLIQEHFSTSNGSSQHEHVPSFHPDMLSTQLSVYILKF